MIAADLAACLALLCALVPAWVYAGYPLLLVVRRATSERRVKPGAPPRSVSIVIPCHQEERSLPGKLASVLAAEGVDGAEIVIVSDGSTDATVTIAQDAARRRRGTLVLDLPRVGKARALDAAVEASTGEIVVFSDANATWERQSLRELLAPFGDPEVGGVAGVQLYRKDSAVRESAGEGESAYWRWDTWLKEQESAIHSCYAADGSLYAIRRELYVPIADPAQADDMAISMRVVTQGRRLVLAPRAIAWEDAPKDPGKELARKIRITNHSLRSLFLLGADAYRGWYGVVLVSHKLLRHLTPLFLVACLALSLVAAPWSSLAKLLLVPQALVYLSAVVGWALRRTWLGRFKPLLVPYYFCLANAAALVGSVRALTGRRITSWTHDRGAAPPEGGRSST